MGQTVGTRGCDSGGQITNSTERYDRRAVIGREGIISDANEDDNFAVQGKGILARIQWKRGGGVNSRNCDKRLPSKGMH